MSTGWSNRHSLYRVVWKLWFGRMFFKPVSCWSVFSSLWFRWTFFITDTHTFWFLCTFTSKLCWHQQLSTCNDDWHN